MASTPDKEAQGSTSVEKRKSTSASKVVASGDRGATGKARLEFRKGFYNKDTKDSLDRSSKSTGSRARGKENIHSAHKEDEQVVSPPIISPKLDEVESKSPFPVSRNLGTEFLSVEGTPQPKSKAPEHFSGIKLLSITILAVSIFFAFTYYSPPIQLPFCDSNNSKVLEDCRPCPSHGTCSAGELTCDHGFIESAGKCVEDKTFSVVTKDTKNRIEAILRKRAGMSLCGTGEVQKEMDSAQLRKAVLLSFGTKLPLEEIRFNRAFTEAFYTIVNDSVSSDEFECREEGERIWCQALHPSLSLSCRLRFFVLQEWWKLLITMSILIGISRLYFWFRLRRWIDKQVKTVTEEVYRQLTASSQLTSPLSERKKVVVTRLRDDLLHDQSLLKWKDVIWRKVVERVDSDSRVQKRREIVNDLPQLVWEWHDKIV
ncbi:uncharacterized protein Gasu_52420 [Galdieria sulphuraria]|uniref:Man1/Src1-like C-terminal domain-containing protein n=1 Tax=Galdieria sulphuraria TaxID=130081 RepID=M2XUP2_GALSU|nr:uncharacterized protein Gasu_52420 [Galdieria sulphuraria]EME27139.1 hypothetical protein Gasu_52420 [Galdieria sulphuraria]|eukprot:XP_005703659.1 hypothetical protein Gasu_52420 [Galdieria sulphuraria]